MCVFTNILFNYFLKTANSLVYGLCWGWIGLWFDEVGGIFHIKWHCSMTGNSQYIGEFIAWKDTAFSIDLLLRRQYIGYDGYLITSLIGVVMEPEIYTWRLSWCVYNTLSLSIGYKIMIARVYFRVLNAFQKIIPSEVAKAYPSLLEPTNRSNVLQNLSSLKFPRHLFFID